MELSNEQKDKLLRKIKKSLALSQNNSNENEAQTALLKAQEMMAKYNLSLSEIDLKEHDKMKESDIQVAYKGRGTFWVKSLARIIADNFRCYYFYSTLNRKTYIKFLGLKEDVEIAKEVYTFAVDVIDFYSKMYILDNMIEGKGEITKSKNSYIVGFLSGLKDKFKEQVNKNNWGLILVKDALVDQAYGNLKLVRGRSSNSITTGDSKARAEGYKQGKSFEGRSSRQVIEG